MKIPQSWTFKDEEVAAAFDTHVREQLPWYDILTNMVSVIAKHYMPENSLCYDIGCSTGNMGKKLRDTIIARKIQWIGIDNSEEMRQFYKAPGTLYTKDALEFEYKPFNLCICFLSIMFMPVEKRRQWLDDMINRMKEGGACIIVDKQEPVAGVLGLALQRSLWEQKVETGTKPEEVVKKEFSLCGIQRPIARNFFDGLNVTEFFRFGDFAGWIIENS